MSAVGSGRQTRVCRRRLAVAWQLGAAQEGCWPSATVPHLPPLLPPACSPGGLAAARPPGGAGPQAGAPPPLPDRCAQCRRCCHGCLAAGHKHLSLSAASRQLVVLLRSRSTARPALQRRSWARACARTQPSGRATQASHATPCPPATRTGDRATRSVAFSGSGSVTVGASQPVGCRQPSKSRGLSAGPAAADAPPHRCAAPLPPNRLPDYKNAQTQARPSCIQRGALRLLLCLDACAGLHGACQLCEGRGKWSCWASAQATLLPLLNCVPPSSCALPPAAAP